MTRLQSAATDHKALRSFPSAPLFLLLFLLLFLGGCAKIPVHFLDNRGEVITIETTAYCDCSICCDWERGSWRFLKMDFWNRYISKGNQAGQEYTGQTASGTYPREAGRFTYGTIAADTRYYPFGTKMYVPGYGWGIVEDRGGAIKGPKRIDLFYDSHEDALKWGRKTLKVRVIKP